MNRRRLLRSGTVGAAGALLAGCFGGSSPSGTAAQSGWGHPCEDPRLVDHVAVEEYRDRGVSLESATEAVHTACVTVRREGRTPEERASEPPPLERFEYEVHPGTRVEIFRFRDLGRYTVRVEREAATRRETFDLDAASFDDGETDVTTFAVVGPERIRVTRRDGG